MVLELKLEGIFLGYQLSVFAGGLVVLVELASCGRMELERCWVWK